MSTAPQPATITRHEGIGSSEVAAACGISPWCSPWELWAQKKELVPDFEGNEATEWGTLLEGVIADRWWTVTGKALVPARTYQHPKHPWAFATPDRLTIDDPPQLIEIKNIGRYAARDWEDDTPPAYYAVQWHWQSWITGIRSGEIAALICGNELRRFPMQAHDPLQTSLFRKAEVFYRRHIVGDEEPPVNGSESERDAMKERWPYVSEDVVIQGDAVAERLAWKLRDANDVVRKAEKLKRRREHELKRLIGDSAGVEGEGWRVTWKANKNGQRTFRSTFKK